jgi:TRAP-type C4-dicarboxylate transport system permease small subunit
VTTTPKAGAVPVAALVCGIERYTTGVAMWGAGAMLVIAVSIGLYQIVSRFVLEQPAEWSEISVRYALIWMVFLGIPTAFRQGAMVCVDLLYRKSGKGMRRVLDAVILVTSLLLMAITLWFGADYAWRTRFQTIPGIESFAVSWAYAAMPVGAVFSIIAILGQWFDPRRNDLETAQ